MEFNDYQQQINNFADFNQQLGPYITGLNVVSADGKLSENLVDVLNKQNGVLDKKDIAKIEISLGDIMQWLSTTATTIGIDLDEIAMMNIRKNYLIHQQQIVNE